MKNSIFRKTLVILFMIFSFSCRNTTMYDVYKDENIPLELNGKVTDIDFYKGGNTTLTVENKTGQKTGAFDRRFNDLIQLGDSIMKKPFSNKCLIIRRDSIFFLDCYEFKGSLKDSFPTLPKWNETIKGKWISKNSAEVKNLIKP